MEINRGRYQGVRNIVQFNWHLYAVAGLVVLGIISAMPWMGPTVRLLAWVGIGMIVMTLGASLVVSYYVYDVSPLYKLPWLGDVAGEHILNIHSGFDEISSILRHNDAEMALTICDFYDPKKHTEVSIKRARKAYPPAEETISVKTDALPFADGEFDRSIAFLSAHEIRKDAERIVFFTELKRVTKPEGQIIVTEHVRDRSNFLAYNIGAFHFHSRATWQRTFGQAGLVINQEIKTTAFITTFILTRD